MKGKREFYKETPEKAKKQSRLTPQQRLLTVLACVLAVTVLGVFTYQKLFVRPDLPGNGDKNSLFPSGQNGEEIIDYGDGVRPISDGKRKSEDYYTVLILGRDTGGGGNTDTMLLASYDVTNQKATVMSIPRDTMVNVSWDVKKINSVYNVYGGGEKGIQALYKEISQLVGFQPDYKVIIEWEAVGKIVDAIGGVYFDNPYPMDYHDPAQDLVIEQPAGYRLLTGDDAMQVIRWRKNDHDSPYGYATGGVGDDGRMKLQQDFLKAVIKQMMTPKNVLNIGKIAKVFQENVETDLSFQNILWFGKQAFSGGLNVEDVNFLTMPWSGASAYSRTLSKQMGKDIYLSYVVPQASKLLTIVNEQLSPFERVFTLSDLDIMSVNQDGTLSSSTGVVEDKQAAQPPQKIGNGSEATPPVDENENAVDPETGEVIQPAEPGEITGEPGGNTGEPAAPDPTPTTPDDPGTAPEPTDPATEPSTPVEEPQVPETVWTPLPDVDPATGEPYPAE